jgi:hypothetical protein
MRCFVPREVIEINMRMRKWIGFDEVLEWSLFEWLCLL